MKRIIHILLLCLAVLSAKAEQNSGQAREMAELATQHGIHLLTNYETTWYGSHEAAAQLIRKGEIGEIRKAIFRDGHTGSVERNTHPEMIPWIKDPVLNGGGAVMDFGCYGTNLMTWLMDNRKPRPPLS